MENWKKLPGFAHEYEVSDHGRVRSLDRTLYLVSKTGNRFERKQPGKVLSPFKANPTGHVQVKLGNTSRYVHTLVLLAFVGPRPWGHVTLHLNHIPHDNRLVNLRYGTYSENILMDFEVGTRKRGPRK